MTTYTATNAAETLTGGSGNDIFVSQHKGDIAGDTYDGGAGTDILKITSGMMMIDLPANGFDFSTATILSIEELDFNYMGMSMPGQAIFSSAQFGDGLIANNLVVKGAWGLNDITVNLVAGDSGFDASGWTFPVGRMMGALTDTGLVNGIPSGNAHHMWGDYIYTGTGAYNGHNVGAPQPSDQAVDGNGNPLTTPIGNVTVGMMQYYYEFNYPADVSASHWPLTYLRADGTVAPLGSGDTIHLTGSGGANTIVGSIVADIISGGDGNDALTGGGGNDTINGGAGDDTALFSGDFDDYTITKVAGTLTVVDRRVGSPDGTDTLTGIEHLKFAHGSLDTAPSGPYGATLEVDLLVGTGEDEEFYTNKQTYLNAGDVFDGGDGIDVLWAGRGMGEDEPDMMYDEDYDFTMVSIRNMEQLAFNYMPMEMPGSVKFTSDQFGAGLLSNNLVVWGAWGDNDIMVDLVDGNSSFNASAWTFPTDDANGAAWGPRKVGGVEVGGNDTIHLTGSGGDNAIVGSRMADIITGGAGNDTLTGGGGADRLEGGVGNDTYVADGRDTIVESADSGIDTVLSAASLVLGANLENLTLTGTGAINATGNELANHLIGNAGANILNGGGGADVLEGGRGSDTYVVGAGDTIVEASGGGTDTVRSSFSFTLGDNLENLVLTGAAVSGTGNGLANTLTGTTGANRLDGGAGADHLIGGRGSDILTGGSGRDHFVFTALSDSTRTAADRIVDFRLGDKIDLHLLDANVSKSGNQAFVLDPLGAGSFMTGHIRQTVVGDNLVLDFNTDRDADVEMRIVVLDHGPLKIGDFVL